MHTDFRIYKMNVASDFGYNQKFNKKKTMAIARFQIFGEINKYLCVNSLDIDGLFDGL